MSQAPGRIGRVTRCSIRGFVGGIRLPEPDLPRFGTFCKAEAQRGRSHVIGLLYDIRVEDDELARQVAAADVSPEEARADQRLNRPIPIEIEALAVGYAADGRYHQRLPPQPPLTMADILPLTPDEVHGFTERLDFVWLIAAARELPVDDLLLAALHTAAEARPLSARRDFLLQAGAACARLMAQDINRLDQLMRQLGSVATGGHAPSPGPEPGPDQVKA